MRISKMGMKNVKLSNLDEMYPAQDILFQTNQVKQYGSGVYAYDNIPLKVQDNIEEVIKKCFNKADCIEVQMPLLQQEEMWKRSGRYDNYIEEGVMMTSKTDKGNYCLAPTAEEAITTFVENRVTSHKQLPAVFYQIGPKFRNEIRNRGYLLRGKEFLMFDLYSFDKDEEGMMQTYKKIRDTYFEVFRKLQLDIVAVAADNGSMGGKNSEEIMALSRIGEDTILFDEDTKQGLNVEVLEKENAEQYLKEVYNINDIRKLHERKAVELGHIFALGTKYSESMQINYIDDQNNSKPFYMGCYGIGVSRVLGLIYENNIIKENDKIVGFSLPIPVTPYYVYLISNDKKKEDLEKLYSEFNEKDIDVIIDDVKGSIGEKIRNAKILGIPYIAIMGNNFNEYIKIIADLKEKGKKIFLEGLKEKGLEFLGFREVPVNSSDIGKTALKAMPYFLQAFVKKPKNIKSGLDFERIIYSARRIIEKKASNVSKFYICSFSSRTIVYKGMLISTQLSDFYIDFKDIKYLNNKSILFKLAISSRLKNPFSI